MLAFLQTALPASLPPTLTRLIHRQQVRRRLRGLVVGLLLVVGAVVVNLLEHTASGQATALLLAGLGTVVAAWPFVVPDLPTHVVKNEGVIWAFRHTLINRGSVSDSLVLATDTGLEGHLAVDASTGDLEAALRELQLIYPHAHLGHSPALRAAYDADPARLRAAGPRGRKTIWHHIHRFRVPLLVLGGLAIACAWMILPVLMLR